MNFIKKLFYKPVVTNYPPQVIPEKALELINSLDSYLAMHSSATITDGGMVVKSAKITLNFQHMSVSYLAGFIKKNIHLSDYSYVPRSVAFIIEADGTWAFYYSLRMSDIDVNINECNLFLDALNRTNNAR